MKRFAISRLMGALACTAALSVAHAATSSFVGTVAVDDPKMQAVAILTPDCVGVAGTQVPYRAIPFSVDANGVYAFSGPNAGSAIHVYAGAFNPGAPLANCIAASKTLPCG